MPGGKVNRVPTYIDISSGASNGWGLGDRLRAPGGVQGHKAPMGVQGATYNPACISCAYTKTSKKGGFSWLGEILEYLV